MAQKDLTETKLFNLKQLWLIGVVVVGGTAALTMGYFQLDAKANGAIKANQTLSEDVVDLSGRLAVIECLIRQQNYHQFYKRVPGWECK